MNPTAKAFWIAEPGRGELRTENLPPVNDNQVLVRTRFSAVSRGTESLVFNGRVPASEYQRMRAPFQSGDFPAPVKYGYACVGEIEEGSEQLRGQTVFCLHPHQDRFVVPADAVVPIPHSVPANRAILAATMETALNGLWDSQAGPGDRISVVGGGMVGALIAWLAGRLPGADVTLIDILPQRAALARHLGVAFALPDQASSDQDRVFHTSASEAGLATALRLAGEEARIIEMSWYGQQQPRLSLGEAFHARRLTLQSSQVGRIPPARAPRWDFRRRLAKAIDLLADPTLDALISGESRFEQLPAIMPQLADARADVLCHRICY